MEYWKEKLTSWDSELCAMVESLTEMPCKPKNYAGCNDGYYIEADYSKHNNPDYILAISNAIAGRLGKRLINIENYPDRQILMARVKFKEDNTIGFRYRENPGKENPESGETYCHKLEEIKAIQVRPDNVDKLLEFIGNGEFEKEAGKLGTFHFLNASGSVWAHAAESDYIVFVKDGLFKVVSKADFQNEYESK